MRVAMQRPISRYFFLSGVGGPSSRKTNRLGIGTPVTSERILPCARRMKATMGFSTKSTSPTSTLDASAPAGILRRNLACAEKERNHFDNSLVDMSIIMCLPKGSKLNENFNDACNTFLRGAMGCHISCNLTCTKIKLQMMGLKVVNLCCYQWRHQDWKSGGGGGARMGQRLIMGGGQNRASRFFLNCWGPIFFGQTCARSAHSERVSASRFWVGSRGPP